MTRKDAKAEMHSIWRALQSIQKYDEVVNGKRAPKRQVIEVKFNQNE